MPEFYDRLERIKPYAAAYSGTLYRSSAPKYANSRDLLTGEGSRRFGGRWNPAGIAAFYGSLSPEAAMAETLAYIRYYGLPAQSAMPRTFVAVEVELSHVLDLTDGKVRQSLGVSLARMLECDWRAEVHAEKVPITHQIGEAVFNTGLEGLLVPSAAAEREVNLVFYPEVLQPKSRAEVVSADRL